MVIVNKLSPVLISLLINKLGFFPSWKSFSVITFSSEFTIVIGVFSSFCFWTTVVFVFSLGVELLLGMLLGVAWVGLLGTFGTIGFSGSSGLSGTSGFSGVHSTFSEKLFGSKISNLYLSVMLQSPSFWHCLYVVPSL